MSTDLALQNSLIVQGRWNEVKLYGLCVDECPKSSPTTKPIPDYGWLEASEGAHAEEWPVYISTATVLNRCLPISEKNSSTAILCAEPTCHQVFGKKTNRCYSQNKDVVGHDTWQILSKAEAGKCNRELDLSVSTTTKQVRCLPARPAGLLNTGDTAVCTACPLPLFTWRLHLLISPPTSRRMRAFF
jgi:hypothetical protein